MTTNQIMETRDRELNGVIIRQRTKDEFFNLNDIVFCVEESIRKYKRGARINFSDFIQQQNIKAFLKELENEIGCNPYIKGAKNRSGWIHPFFAIKILTHFNPKFEIQVYKWLWDYLIKNRISSGDSFNKMCGTLYKYADNKSKFPENIKKVAKMIQEIICCDDWNKASELQLKRRDELQTYITDLTQTLKNSSQGLSLGIKIYQEKYLKLDKGGIE